MTTTRKAKRLIPCLLAALTGAGLTLTYAPFSHWYLTPILLGALFWLLANRASSYPALLGFSFGLGWFGAGISWVHVSIADFGGLPLLGSVGLMVLLCAYLSLYPALACWLLVRIVRPGYWPLAIGFIWLVAEWLRSWMLTGFPWLSLGYSQIDSPLAGWMPLIGETGVSVLLVTLSCALARLVPRKQYALVLLLLFTFYGSGALIGLYQWTTAKDELTDVVMVQGNIKQELRWVPEQDLPTMNLYRQMTLNHLDADLIIWPEAAIPRLEPLALEYLDELDSHIGEQGTGLITGIVNYNFETGSAYNQLIALGSQNGEKHGHYAYPHVNRYAKHHLLPIGEFIPFESWLRGLAPIFDLPMSSFTRGDYQQTNLTANGYRVAPAICFEIAFPRQLSANLHPYTDFILTVSNDAWFGRSHGPHQHMEIARVRAREFGIPVLRATNNGITGIIDADGSILAQLPQFTTQVLRASVPLYAGTTPYARFGDLWATLLSFLAAILALWLPRSDRFLS
ncbi:apolipoprotein N-acyltransferase [Lacimicrobium sp. SS2-24]|uniref:apolipoprotein N-acyltransferase n=1 Tax=Lacimicrobium sp. SS2-24 TaxID=2005569 RepID=UPI000B4AD649|nr:apolipoprotein N-acyltransferase [Lacimicrobium sp. SS2-24]